eukprot:TRINITY_DN696_c0_g1_i4.p1 TRINITY_DN696_c0_g1~~TRINITY_DN696_c0_g1_i4.p1  ORF type:complete len:264 (+),score=76.46 TRINITY_DN696_c0_g1_i4:245-1036(+)
MFGAMSFSLGGKYAGGNRSDPYGGKGSSWGGKGASWGGKGDSWGKGKSWGGKGGGFGKGAPPSGIGLQVSKTPLSPAEYEVAAAALMNTPGMKKAEAIGLQLADEAMQNLLKLPADAASELLEIAAEKSTTLRDPSNYINATIARGYQPRSGTYGGNLGGKINETSAAALMNTPGMQKAQAAGLVLTDEAIQSLLTLPLDQASELLGGTADKGPTLRDPSNYININASIARGYYSRSGGGGGEGCMRLSQEDISPGVAPMAET